MQPGDKPAAAGPLGRRRVQHRKAASDTFAWAASALLQELPPPAPHPHGPELAELGPAALAAGPEAGLSAPLHPFLPAGLGNFSALGSAAGPHDGAPLAPPGAGGAPGPHGQLLPEDLLDLLAGVEEEEMGEGDPGRTGDLDWGAMEATAGEAQEAAGQRAAGAEAFAGRELGEGGLGEEMKAVAGGAQLGNNGRRGPGGRGAGAAAVDGAGSRHPHTPAAPPPASLPRPAAVATAAADKALAEFGGQTRGNALDPAALDPKRARRIIANRQSAHRSRLKKLQLIHELEGQVTAARSATDAVRQQVAAAAAARRGALAAAAALQAQLAEMGGQLAAAAAARDAAAAELRSLGLSPRGPGAAGPGMGPGMGAPSGAEVVAGAGAGAHGSGGGPGLGPGPGPCIRSQSFTAGSGGGIVAAQPQYTSPPLGHSGVSGAGTHQSLQPRPAPTAAIQTHSHPSAGIPTNPRHQRSASALPLGSASGFGWSTAASWGPPQLQLMQPQPTAPHPAGSSPGTHRPPTEGGPAPPLSPSPLGAGQAPTAAPGATPAAGPPSQSFSPVFAARCSAGGASVLRPDAGAALGLGGMGLDGLPGPEAHPDGDTEVADMAAVLFGGDPGDDEGLGDMGSLGEGEALMLLTGCGGPMKDEPDLRDTELLLGPLCGL